MNLSNLSLQDSLTLKILDKYYNLQSFSSNKISVINYNGIVFYTNYNYIQASDDTKIEIKLCEMSHAFSDHILSSFKDDDTLKFYIYEMVMKHITKLDNQMMELTYGKGSFVPVLGPFFIQEEILTYSIGGYCSIKKEVYYETQKNQQNKML